MKLFIVVDKQECVSWICSDIESVFESTGRDGLFNNLNELKGEYEVIEVNGDIKYLID